jgi:hypothetical protein
MNGILFSCFCCLLSLNAICQQLIQGVLIDSISREPVEFANVGLVGRALGTVTNDKGEFSLLVADSLKEFPLKISMIGYKEQSFKLKQLTKEKNVILLPRFDNPLPEVTVKAPKLKVKIVGNETTTKSITAGFINNNLGAELAIRLRIKNAGTEIRKFMLNISNNTLSVSPVFRLNIYEVSKDGSPGKNILRQNIIITPQQQKGLITEDLTPYGITANSDVFIAVEWIKDLGNAKGLFFSSRVGGNATWFRLTSQAPWQKVGVIGIGLHAEIAY